MRAPKLLRYAGGFLAIVAAGWLEDAGDVVRDLGDWFSEVGDTMAALSEQLMPTSELLGEFWDECWGDADA
jgi:hypothetical protein